MNRTLLVGLDNTNKHARTWRQALLPFPRGSAGQRLSAMLEERHPHFTRAHYLSEFDRINLYPFGRCANGKGSTAMDRKMGEWLWAYADDKRYEDVVLLGPRIWSALQPKVGAAPFDFGHVSRVMKPGRTVRFHLVPHPSGRNTKYNDPAYRRAAADLLLSLIGECRQ